MNLDRFWLLFTGSPTPLFETTSDGRITEANPAFIGMIRAPNDPAVLSSLQLADLLEDPADWNRLKAHMEADGVVRRFDVRIRRLDDLVIWAELNLHLATLGSSGENRVIGSLHDITERKRQEKQLREQALHDPLTGLANRALLRNRLTRAISRLHRDRQHSFAFAFIDLNDFKDINDTFGHIVGDQLLIAVAERLEGCVRPEDTVSRFGGDEFALILDGVDDMESAEVVLGRIRSVLANPFRINGHEIAVGMSIGLSFGEEGREAEHILQEADSRMYRQKRLQRGVGGEPGEALGAEREPSDRLSGERLSRDRTPGQRFPGDADTGRGASGETSSEADTSSSDEEGRGDAR